MINGAHSIVYSKRPEADRAFLKDVLKLPSVDVGGGWLIFGLPPSEMAIHPSENNDVHELYLMCADVEAFVAAMSSRKIACGPVQDQGWGRLTQMTLPGGGKLGVYEPRHARPKPVAAAPGPRKSAARSRSPRAAPRATKRPARKPTKTPAARTKGRKRR